MSRQETPTKKENIIFGQVTMRLGHVGLVPEFTPRSPLARCVRNGTHAGIIPFTLQSGIVWKGATKDPKAMRLNFFEKAKFEARTLSVCEGIYETPMPPK
ncbi:hypothetical protein P691DRAFT_543882 [Macrolepiota fuliginosa MF-IS2]|uniref:Uncharacterized protein n=1 Tax=Macrolepiota fuliginosa MF-IS2 TaxID=1400762 RepID=A0A9P5XDZ7_9AGAR|nr:hypothetical protein P691DRAFT_543882 [Macrolepiota fuliginosa MF-IS2]